MRMKTMEYFDAMPNEPLLTVEIKGIVIGVILKETEPFDENYYDVMKGPELLRTFAVYEVACQFARHYCIQQEKKTK